MRLIANLFVTLERNSLGDCARHRGTWAIFWKILTMSSCLGWCLSAQDVVAVLFFIAFRIIFFLIETQREILQNVDNLSIFLSLTRFLLTALLYYCLLNQTLGEDFPDSCCSTSPTRDHLSMIWCSLTVSQAFWVHEFQQCSVYRWQQVQGKLMSNCKASCKFQMLKCWRSGDLSSKIQLWRYYWNEWAR